LLKSERKCATLDRAFVRAVFENLREPSAIMNALRASIDVNSLNIARRRSRRATVFIVRSAAGRRAKS
jgi:hypothetical protein